jgi:hypothetical protein
MTESILAHMRGKRASPYTPGPANKAGADGGPPPLRITNPPKALANPPGNASSQYPNNTGKGSAAGNKVHILPAKPPSNKAPSNKTPTSKAPSNKAPSNKTLKNKTSTNKSPKNKGM